MGTVTPLDVAVVSGLIAVAGLLRWLTTKGPGGGPVSQRDMQVIETALASEGGHVVRVVLDRSGNLIARNEYLAEREGARLYHVTAQIGSVTIRRRMSVRDGRPATILP